MTNRQTRYQGAIIRDHHVLLIKQRLLPSGRFIWLFPGGGIEPGENEKDCVEREIKEETHLNVKMVSLLLEEHHRYPDGTNQRVKTFLCEPDASEASPGIEPETPGYQSIFEVKWFDLSSEANWDPLLVNDPIIYKPLQQIRKKLGYLS